jgi:hypothetical protein
LSFSSHGEEREKESREGRGEFRIEEERREDMWKHSSLEIETEIEETGQRRDRT